MAGGEKLAPYGVRGELYLALQTANVPEWVGAISPFVKSNEKEELYAWLGATPALSEWKAGRQVTALSDDEWTIRNVQFEATIPIKDKDMRRDKLGQIQLAIQEFAAQPNQHWIDLMVEFINNGHTRVCYDGQFFFDTDHAEDNSGTQDNDLTVDISAVPAAVHGTTANPSVEEFQEAMLTGAQQIVGFLNNQGKPMNRGVKDFVILCPLAHWRTAIKSVSQAVIGNGATNPLAGGVIDGFSFRIHADPQLTATDTIFVFGTTGGGKALIRQEEYAPRIQHLGEGSDHFFKTNEHLFGVDVSRAVGYGRWQHACRVQLV